MSNRRAKTDNIEKILIKLGTSGNRISDLDLLADQFRQQSAALTCYHYGILESHIFLRSLNELKKIASKDKVRMLDAAEPMIDWLDNYKRGLAKYRNKRVAHISDLDTLSIEYFRKYTLPSSEEDFRNLFFAISFLDIYIKVIYTDELKVIEMKSSKETEAARNKPRIQNRNSDISDARRRTIENIISLDLQLPSPFLDYCKRFLNI